LAWLLFCFPQLFVCCPFDAACGDNDDNDNCYQVRVRVCESEWKDESFAIKESVHLCIMFSCFPVVLSLTPAIVLDCKSYIYIDSVMSCKGPDDNDGLLWQLACSAVFSYISITSKRDMQAAKPRQQQQQHHAALRNVWLLPFSRFSG